MDKKIFDPAQGKVVYVCEFGSGPCDPEALLAPTLGDRYKALVPRARVVALANKDRAAMLLGGRRADLVAWFDAAAGRLQGRTAEGPGVPDWLNRIHARARAVRPDAWVLPELPSGVRLPEDDAPGEIDRGFGVTFPHRVPAGLSALQRDRLWMETPDVDRALVDTVLGAARELHLGRGPASDLLLISMSSLDAIGHTFGPDSVERIAALVELDRNLGRLLRGLEELTEGSLFLALTSDHGVAATAEHVRRRFGVANPRVRAEELQTLLEEALRRRFGAGDYVRAVWFPYVTLHPQPASLRAVVAAEAAQVLRGHPAVEAAWTVAELARVPDPLAQLLFENTHPRREAHIAFVLRPHHQDWDPSEGDQGCEHGSPWEYDRHVPAVLFGAEVVPGTVTRAVRVIDIVRSIADRLGLPPDPRGGEPPP
jgi:hypothetical protein